MYVIIGKNYKKQPAWKAFIGIIFIYLPSSFLLNKSLFIGEYTLLIITLLISCSYIFICIFSLYFVWSNGQGLFFNHSDASFSYISFFALLSPNCFLELGLFHRSTEYYSIFNSEKSFAIFLISVESCFHK